ncbi:MAG: hypothetical protein CM1200mP41_31040 [Gammaproteobacteria bacterium]|nr:MAG: hypothetical protein CM1200mP41_31040 [Gammaproteobacteria bacterium]
MTKSTKIITGDEIRTARAYVHEETLSPPLSPETSAMHRYFP